MFWIDRNLNLFLSTVLKSKLTCQGMWTSITFAQHVYGTGLLQIGFSYPRGNDQNLLIFNND